MSQTSSIRWRSGAALASALALALAACGGDSPAAPPADTGVAPSPSPTPTPSPTPSPSPTPTPTPTPTSAAIDPTRAADLYAAAPDIAACDPGRLKDEVVAGAIAALNAIRALHALPPVQLSAADSRGAQESALMMLANESLSHSPPASWRCWTQAGADAAGAGNLAYSRGYFPRNRAILGGWMDEVDNLSLDNVGHRRWMLDPFMTHTAYGRVSTGDGGATRNAAVLQVFDLSASGATPTGLPDFVAYPHGPYPAEFWAEGALHSFTLLADKQHRFGGNTRVDFASASVTVRDRATGGVLPLSKLSYDNTGYGVPNNLQFLPAGIAKGRTYEVRIADIRVDGAPREVRYTFSIVD